MNSKNSFCFASQFLLFAWLVALTPSAFAGDRVSSCGGAGEPACLLWQAIPSCDGSLTESGGRCVSTTSSGGGSADFDPFGDVGNALEDIWDGILDIGQQVEAVYVEVSSDAKKYGGYSEAMAILAKNELDRFTKEEVEALFEFTGEELDPLACNYPCSEFKSSLQNLVYAIDDLENSFPASMMPTPPEISLGGFDSEWGFPIEQIDQIPGFLLFPMYQSLGGLEGIQSVETYIEDLQVQVDFVVEGLYPVVDSFVADSSGSRQSRSAFGSSEITDACNWLSETDANQPIFYATVGAAYLGTLAAQKYFEELLWKTKRYRGFPDPKTGKISLKEVRAKKWRNLASRMEVANGVTAVFFDFVPYCSRQAMKQKLVEIDDKLGALDAKLDAIMAEQDNNPWNNGNNGDKGDKNSGG